MLDGTKLFSGPVISVNQVQFIAPTKNTADGLGDAVAVTSLSIVRGNDIGSDSRVRIVPVAEIGLSSDGKYDMGSGIEVGTGDNLEDAEVCLDAVLATAASPAFLRFNIAMPIFSISRGYLTSISSIVKVGQAIKP